MKAPARKPRKQKAIATKLIAKKLGQLDTSWHERFLNLLAQTCNVTIATKGAGVCKQTAYEHRQKLPEFALAWDEAKQSAIEILEAEAWQRAKKKSDLLMIFLLKAHNPERYRERFEAQISGSLQIEYVNDWRDTS